jgi:chromosome segregation protein
MHIKKLEISGFKSFVDRTVIHFDHDVIGIVGPNGCGKSNIVDAIRWCMGEQSAKHLRGRAMEDVIFNGSDSRGAAGLSEVTLTFDNSDPQTAAELPEEYRQYPELAITRRLFRDGTSEYLLNKTQVRLRDITELFLGTGVGTKAYSIVEQGRIGQIVSARPEDRRIFIEEAAGITKYKQRRKQAERKMELTRQNLLRLTDIVSEIERTRTSLKRQVAKAERYLQYRDELEDLMLHEASHKYLELVVLGKVQAEALENAGNQSEAASNELEQAEAAIASARREAAEYERLTETASRDAFEADNEVAALHAEIERARERLAHLDQRLESGAREAEEIKSRIVALAEEREQLEQRVQGLAGDESAREADAAAEAEALSVLQSEEAQANDDLQELRAKASQLGKQAAAAEARLDGLARRVEEARVRRDRLAAEREQLDGEIAEHEARSNALSESVAQLAEGKRLTQTEREQLDVELVALRGQLRQSEKSLDSSKNDLGLRRNRLRALADMHRRHEGVGAGAKALLSTNDPAVLGIVADRVEAPEEYNEALAGLLGEKLQYVVVSDMNRGLELLGELRRKERGRAQLIPSHPRYVAGALRTLPVANGVVGFLADRLIFSQQDEALVRSLVGNAVVVETAADAIALSSEQPGLAAVALDGTVVTASGVLSGGAGDGVASAMVEQKRELRLLAEEVERLDAEHQQLAASHHALRARTTEVETALDRARQEAHEGELAHVHAEKDLHRTQETLGHARRRVEKIVVEVCELDALLDQTTTDESSCQSELDGARAELEHLHHELARAEDRAMAWRERVEGQSSLVTERKVRLAQVREQAEAARSALDRVEMAAADLETRASRLEIEMTDAAVAWGQTAAKMVLALETRGDARLRAEEAHQAFDEAKQLLDGVRHGLSAAEGDIKVIRDRLGLADEGVRRAEMALQRLRLEMDHLLNRIAERFRGLDLARVVGDYHARPAPDLDQRRRIEELTQLIDRMGPVNLDAKTEFDDADRRYGELKGQKDDVDQALADLERAIKHMDQESRKRFKEAFVAVNELFKQTFVRMFRGGRAELHLTDPDDLLASGVDIIAQPPGKKLGNIELMSGGEKALTAVSLIFSIFQYKPSPFCILDEVDAPLDEANVARYNEAIRSMTHSSQFILITHIRKTMQTVDVLYGVTMGEPGVSRLVSVKVDENAATRSDTRSANALGSEAPPASASAEVNVA